MSQQPAVNSGPLPASIWQRRVIAPIVRQLQQGCTADLLALTIALGAVLGVFPILGSTTILCGTAAIWLRLNQPVMQVVNYLAYPLQLALLIPFYRAGETLFLKPHTPLSIPMLLERFQAGALQFLRDFSLVALQGIAVWMLVAPIATALLYYSLRPPLRTLASRIAS